jgi:uncharacterized protein (DUF302 family)
MRTTLRDLSTSVRTSASYQQALTRLREALKRHGFETVCEFPLDRELERKVGLRSQHCTVFVVWSPFEAYQAVLSDRGAGLHVLFHLCVAQDGNSTFIAVMNHWALGPNGGPLGLQVLVRGLADKIDEVLVEAAMPEEPRLYREARGSEAPRF